MEPLLLDCASTVYRQHFNMEGLYFFKSLVVVVVVVVVGGGGGGGGGGGECRIYIYIYMHKWLRK